MSRSKRLQTGQLRARFAAGLSAMYAAEVPAYGTLVEVCAQVNSDYLTRHRRAERLGSLQRVTAERHGAIRVGNPAELAAVADLFAAFGMLPVGYYDLRTAESPIPVVSTAFRPIDANELAHNPFRVFTSMLAIEDRRYFDADLRTRVQTFLARRQLFDPALLAQARAIAADGGCDADDAPAFVAAAVAAFALSREPVEKSWYDELSRVSAVAADIAGVGSTHQPSDASGARHRRSVPSDDRARHHHDRHHPRPSPHRRTRCVVAANLISRAGRTTHVSRRGRYRDAGNPAGAVR